jgi:hypothetical protein
MALAGADGSSVGFSVGSWAADLADRRAQATRITYNSRFASMGDFRLEDSRKIVETRLGDRLLACVV